MPSFFESVEQVLKVQNEVAIDHLLNMWGFHLKVYVPSKGIENRVYGSAAGLVKEGDPEEIIGIVVPDDFFPTGPVSGGNMTEGWLYTKANILPDSIVELPSNDNRRRQYRVRTPETIGVTTAILRRYHLAAIVG